jgi:two-component system sensor histidine kinase TctE
VRALARQIKPIGDGLLVDFPKAAQDILEQDPADRVTYMVSSPPGRFLLGNAQLPPPPPVDVRVGEPYLYHARVDSRPVRVALLDVDYGTPQTRQTLRVQVAQSLTVRERIAQELLEQLLLPMGLMGLVLSALVYAGVLRGLQPLKRLEAQIERAGKRSHNTADPLPPIELTSAPQEVHSLASTINRLLEAVARGQQKEKRFLNDAAHQLRTPLAGLIGQTELALHESHEPQVRERLQKVLAAAERSAHLVHQLLQLARSESNVPMQPLNLPQLACEVARH